MIDLKATDLTGQKFGRLTVIKRVDNYVSPKGTMCSQWLCECDCENKTKIIVHGRSLTRGITKSCGCLAKETTSKLKKKYNAYDLTGEYGIGYTSKGEEFYFDLEDYDLIKDYCWRIDKVGYVVSRMLNNNKTISLHRLLYPNTELVDHKNHKKYDNRKSNLRPATASQNNMNSPLKINNVSGVTGVSWHKLREKWRAVITVNKKQIHLGLFTCFEDAVKARKEAEEKYFGEWSYDNSQKK